MGNKTRWINKTRWNNKWVNKTRWNNNGLIRSMG